MDQRSCHVQDDPSDPGHNQHQKQDEIHNLRYWCTRQSNGRTGHSILGFTAQFEVFFGSTVPNTEPLVAVARRH